MIVKMKFLSISGPRIDIDRVCEKYLSKYEMQLENAVTELKTTDNLLPFVEVNPYKDALVKAEQFAALLPEGMPHVDQNMSKDEMLAFIRELNHDYLDLQEKKELLNKKEDEAKEKFKVLEPFTPLNLDLHKTMRYKYMKIRFGRIGLDHYKKLEKYLFDDLQAVFLEGTRNENYVYGCYFVSNADTSKVDSAFNSLHFERITIPPEYIGTPKDACGSMQKSIDDARKEKDEIDRQIEELMSSRAAKLLGARKRLEELSNNFDVRKMAARTDAGDNKEDYYILCGWMGEKPMWRPCLKSRRMMTGCSSSWKKTGRSSSEILRRSLRIPSSSSLLNCSSRCTAFRRMMSWIRRCSWRSLIRLSSARCSEMWGRASACL